MSETSQYTFAAYSVGGIDFPANTISFTWSDTPPTNQVIGLYSLYTEVAHYDSATGQFARGDYFNSQYVNLLTGSWDRYPLGTTTLQTDTGYVFLDLLPWTGGELEVVSQTDLLGAGGPHGVPEPGTLMLFAVALIVSGCIRARLRPGRTAAARSAE